MPHLPYPAKTARMRHIFARVLDGQSTAEIAAAEGVTARRIQQIVAAELARRGANPASDYKLLQIARLEIAFDALGDAIDTGNIAAVPTFLKVAERLTQLSAEPLQLAAPAWRAAGDVAAVRERLDRLAAAREIVAERRRKPGAVKPAKRIEA